MKKFKISSEFIVPAALFLLWLVMMFFGDSQAQQWGYGVLGMALGFIVGHEMGESTGKVRKGWIERETFDRYMRSIIFEGGEINPNSYLYKIAREDLDQDEMDLWIQTFLSYIERHGNHSDSETLENLIDFIKENKTIGV